jgi:hypothetical protein
MALEQDLLAIEHALWTGGPEAFEQHAHEHCLVVFAEMAQVMTKADIAKTAEKGRWKDVAMRPKGMVRLSEAVAVIAYECTAGRKDGRSHHAYVSSGYVGGPHGWKLAFHQQTAING